jgi:hydroxymethylpyrimidine pyrophosphatase-like HAD family hydrolase
MKTICVDIDGTLVHYEKWQGDNHFGKLVPGAAEAMKKLKEKDWFIIIYTTRGNKEAVRKFLNENNIVYDSINENPYQPDNAIGGKLLADVYIDDRAITFDGNWQLIVDKIVSFKTWEQ